MAKRSISDRVETMLAEVRLEGAAEGLTRGLEQASRQHELTHAALYVEQFESAAGRIGGNLGEYLKGFAAALRGFIEDEEAVEQTEEEPS